MHSYHNLYNYNQGYRVQRTPGQKITEKRQLRKRGQRFTKEHIFWKIFLHWHISRQCNDTLFLIKVY